MRLLALLIAGLCTYYNPGVMERVAAYRKLDCAECVGAVAVLDCEQLGERVWLAPSTAPSLRSESAQPAPPALSGRDRAGGVGQGDDHYEGPFLVVDCAEKKHRANLERRGLVAEVDWQTSRRWRMAGPVECEMRNEGGRGKRSKGAPYRGSSSGERMGGLQE